MVYDILKKVRRKSEPDRYGRTELAALLRTSLSTVDFWIASKRIVYDSAEGRRKYFSRERVEQFLLKDYLVPKRPTRIA